MIGVRAVYCNSLENYCLLTRGSNPLLSVRARSLIGKITVLHIVDVGSSPAGSIFFYILFIGNNLSFVAYVK